MSKITVLRSAVVLLGSVLMTATCTAQGVSVLLIPWSLESGALVNTSDEPCTVWSSTVHIPGAASLQLLFEAAELADSGDIIEIVGEQDNATMRLDSSILKLWESHSAWFNGDTLRVRVVLQPRSRAWIAVDSVAAMTGPSQIIFGDSICGTTDDRVVSTEPRVCRFVGTGTPSAVCSGFLIGTTPTILSAGSCTNPSPGVFFVAQFNVPASTSLGVPRHPPVEDQYPVHRASIRSENSVPGDNWSVMRIHPNSAGQTAISRQGNGYVLSTSLPTINPPTMVPTLRVTGHGSDTADPRQLSTSFRTQTATGPAGLPISSSALTHLVDTGTGSEGSPVVLTSNGRPVAVHVGDGCTASAGSNTATSVLVSDFAAAIAEVRGNGMIQLSQGSSSTVVTATNTIFAYAPQQGRWNLIALSPLRGSTTDWDIATETSAGSGASLTARSILPGSACDYIIADGHAGNVTPIDGRIYRVSGSGETRAQSFVPSGVNGVITLGAPPTATLYADDSRLLALHEFAISTPGDYDIHVYGRNGAGNRWHLHRPRANGTWVGRQFHQSDAHDLGLGRQRVNLGSGTHALVVVSDEGGELGGVGAWISITPAQSDVVLSSTFAALQGSGPRPFELSFPPGALTSPRWSGVAVIGNGDAEVLAGDARDATDGLSLRTVRYLLTEGVVAPSWLTTIGHRRGLISGSSLLAGQLVSRDLPLLTRVDERLESNRPAALLQFQTISAGNFDLRVVSSSSRVRYHLHSASSTAATGTFDYWQSSTASMLTRSASISSNLPAEPETIALPAGTHALVIMLDGYFSGNADVSVFVSPTPPSIPLPLTNTSGVATSLQVANISLTAVSGRWNVVGADALSPGTLVALGTAIDQSTSGQTSYVIANGNAGLISSQVGFAAFDSSPVLGGRIAHGAITTLPIGTAFNASWSSTSVVRVFEFMVSAAGSYDLSVTSQTSSFSINGPWWSLHLPTTDAEWMPASSAALSRQRVSAQLRQTLQLQPGVHAVVIEAGIDSGGLSGSIRLLVEPTPNPLPSLLSLSPNSAVVGSTVNFVAQGANFVPGASVRVDGSAVTTSFQSSSLLSATLPSNFLASAGVRAISVFNPAPGGGLSNTINFSVTNPAPSLNSVLPSTVPVGASLATFTLTGQGFVQSSAVLVNGQTVASTWISSTRIDTTLPMSYFAKIGQISFVIFNAAPGGGSSAQRFVEIAYPAPSALGIVPSSVTAGDPRASICGLPGSGDLVIVVTGSNFNPGSVVRNGLSTLQTVFLSSTQLNAVVPGFSLASAGTLSISVFTPPPGGGSSNAIALSVLGPSISSLSPASIPLMTPGSESVIAVDGTNFHCRSTVYAHDIPVPTVFESANRLRATIRANDFPILQHHGAVVLSVSNSPLAFSEPNPLQPTSTPGLLTISSPSNRGAFARSPITQAPGQPYTLELVLPGVSAVALSLIADFGPVTSNTLYPFPGPNENFALHVRPFPPASMDWVALVDGLGLYGQPQPTGISTPFGLFQDSRYTLNGVTPSPLLGLAVTFQAVWLDPSSMSGYRLSWPFSPARF